MHDPALGRFMGIDLLADVYSSQSPYAYAINNPISFVDYLGMGPEDVFNRGGSGMHPSGTMTQEKWKNLTKYCNCLAGGSGTDPKTVTMGGKESVLLDEATVTGKPWGTLPGDLDPMKSDATASNSSHWNNMTMMGALQYNAVRGHKQSVDILNSIEPGLAYSVFLNYNRQKSGAAFAKFGFWVTSAPAILTGIGAGITSLGEITFSRFAAKTSTSFAEGSFSVFNWKGYPAGGIKPTGPFRLLEGAEYTSARNLANSTNAAMRRANPEMFKGLQIHEIHPVKFGGSPTDLSNKIFLTPSQHAQYTNFWNALMRSTK